MFKIFERNSTERQKLIDKYLKLLGSDELTADQLMELEHLRSALEIQPTIEREAAFLHSVNSRAENYQQLPTLEKERAKAEAAYRKGCPVITAKIAELQRELDDLRSTFRTADAKLAKARLSIKPFAPTFHSEAVQHHENKLRAAGKLPKGDKLGKAPTPAKEVIEEVEGPAEVEPSTAKPAASGNAAPKFGSHVVPNLV